MNLPSIYKMLAGFRAIKAPAMRQQIRKVVGGAASCVSEGIFALPQATCSTHLSLRK